MSATQRLPGQARALFALLALAALASCVDDGCTATTYVSQWHGGGGGVARPPYYIAGSSVSSTVISAGALGGTMEEDAGDPCAPKPLPPEVPEGWIEDRDWSCTCPLYIPGSKDVMPKPIAWEPCPPQPSGIDCRSIVIDWGDEVAILAYGDPQFDRLPDGSALLGIRRVSKATLLDIVAEVDGPVHSAILRVNVPGQVSSQRGCYIVYQSVNEGKYLFSVNGHDRSDNGASNHEGAIGGSIDDPAPTVLTHYIDQDPFDDGWEVGAKWIARVTHTKLVAYPWDMSQEVYVSSAATDSEGLSPGSQLFVHGDAIFWSFGKLQRDGIDVWDPIHGTRPFIRWIGDFTQGAADLGTDGVDLVWAYGKKKPNDIHYAVNSVMTSPFTTDPEKLQPRRLRSLPDNTIGNRQFVVGCGYAAHHMVDDTGAATLVVRISDGVSWIVPHSPTFKHFDALGITCDDVFILGEIAGEPNIMRVRLDSLGPGIPPD